jgi:hypothetical protein
MCEQIICDACTKKTLQQIKSGKFQCCPAKLSASGLPNLVPPGLPRQQWQEHHITHKIHTNKQMSLNKLKQVQYTLKHTFKGSQVQLKLKRFYYNGLLHPTAEPGATKFGNLEPMSLLDITDTETPMLNPVPPTSEIWSHWFEQTEQMQKQTTKLESTKSQISLPPLSSHT